MASSAGDSGVSAEAVKVALGADGSDSHDQHVAQPRGGFTDAPPGYHSHSHSHSHGHSHSGGHGHSHSGGHGHSHSGGHGHSHGSLYDDEDDEDYEEDPDEVAELAHFREVCGSFFEYSLYMLPEMERRERHLEQLSDHYKDLIDIDMQRKKMVAMRDAVRVNQAFCDAIVASHVVGDGFLKPPEHPGSPVDAATGKLRLPVTAPRHFSKVKTTLHQFVREWSEEGRVERERSYGEILRLLKEHLPVTDDTRNKIRVLVPGSGLGRLPLEIASAGYACQGNEFSYQMLLGANLILNNVRQRNATVIHPWIDEPSNVFAPQDMLRPIPIPDVSPPDLLAGNPDADFSMAAGEFLEVYGNQRAEWDSVVTCFFIDTAPIVMEYLELLYDLIQPGGYWINLGPLLFHWQDPGAGGTDARYGQSVELSYAEIKRIAEKIGFQFVYEAAHDVTYSCNIRSMQKTVFTPICFVALRPDPDAPSKASGADGAPAGEEQPATTTGVAAAPAGEGQAVSSGGAVAASGTAATPTTVPAASTAATVTAAATATATSSSSMLSSSEG